MFTIVFSVVCVRSLSSEDHIIAFVYIVGKYCVYFCEHLQCSKKIFLMSDFLFFCFFFFFFSLRGGVL